MPGVTWRAWLPVVLAVGLLGVGLGLADSGRRDGALIVLGAGLMSAGVSVGAWLTRHRDDR